MSLQCPRCEGNGVCTECGGTGSVECRFCNGSGSLLTELPSGTKVYTKCSACLGKGFAHCSKYCEVCQGRGELSLQPPPSPAESKKVYLVASAKNVPTVTYTILIVMVLATIMSGVLWGQPTIVYFLGVFYPPLILEKHEVWRFFSAIFLHGGVMHLLSNAYSLYVLSPGIEILLGKKKFFILFFVSGIIGFLLSALLIPLTPTVGASGALFGVMTSYLGIQMRYNLFHKAIIAQLVFWFALNIWIGFMTPQINIWAHLGGAIAGFLLGYFFKIDQE